MVSTSQDLGRNPLDPRMCAVYAGYYETGVQPIDTT